MPSVSGVLETALYVQDLARSVRFFEELFGFEILVQDNRFCAMNVADRQVFLLFQQGASREDIPTPGGMIPAHDGSGHLHMAFSIPPQDLDHWEYQLREKGIAMESKVTWPRGGQSLYFRDPDGHVIELVTPGTWTVY